MVQVLESNVPPATEEKMSETTAATKTVATKEEPMATTTKKKSPTQSSNKKAAKATKTSKATKAGPKKAAKPKKNTGPKPARVFAIRVTDEELAAIHKAAGPRNATRFVRAVAAAFANADESAFRAVLQEARDATKA
jgi:hypothetical protein